MHECRAVLFVDIADSTRLYRRLGDSAARSLVLQCLGVLDHVVTTQRGLVIDRIGDELMCTFETASAALHAAVRLHEATVPLHETHADIGGFAVRIGVAYGPVIRKDAQIFGNTVYIARRVTSLAKGHQILTTRETVAALPRRHRLEIRHVDTAIVKGYREPLEIHEILWDPARATHRRLDESERGHPRAEALLRYGVREFLLDRDRPLCKIGRSGASDLRIDDHDVSWHHAQIECGKTAVLLTDFSTNGTVLRARGMTAGTVVHRETVELSGEGLIGVGQAPQEGDSVTVWYRCATSA